LEASVTVFALTFFAARNSKIYGLSLRGALAVKREAHRAMFRVLESRITIGTTSRSIEFCSTGETYG